MMASVCISPRPHALQFFPFFIYSNPSEMTGVAKVEKVDLVGVGLNATDTLIPVAHYPARGGG